MATSFNMIQLTEIKILDETDVWYFSGNRGLNGYKFRWLKWIHVPAFPERREDRPRRLSNAWRMNGERYVD